MSTVASSSVIIPEYCQHADVGDISFIVCLFVCFFVRKYFCIGYLQRGLTQVDEIWQDHRPGWVAGHLRLWWILAQGLAPKAKKWKMLVTHWTVASQMWQSGQWWRLACQDMHPIWITGTLVLLVKIICSFLLQWPDVFAVVFHGQLCHSSLCEDVYSLPTFKAVFLTLWGVTTVSCSVN